jgi:acyl-coenzyme A synthetase/AMP-(fatty) acid ligase
MRPLDFIDQAIDRYADRVAFVDTGATYSFRELGRLSSALASALAARGVTARDVVAIWSWSDPWALVCAIGSMRLGAVFALVNAAAGIDENLSYVRSLAPRCVFVHPNVDVARVRGELAEGTLIVCLHESLGGLDVSRLVREATGLPPTDWGDVYGSPDHPVAIAPTGGTTGRAKAVVITCAAYTNYIEAYRRFLRDDDDHPVCLTASQLTPATLSIAVVMCTLGARQLFRARFSATDVSETIGASLVTHMWLPPTGLAALVSRAESQVRIAPALRALVVGGAAASFGQLQKAIEMFGPVICHSYGQMETGTLAWMDQGTLAAAIGGERAERATSCGRINPMMRVAIMHDDGRLLPPMATGEIVARGRGVCDYLDGRALTDAARANGWHHTGDLGFLDADGYLFVVGRTRDLIVTGGCNVYPSRVEAAILELPEVHECAVVGLRDPLLGEIPVAVIVAERGAVSVESVAAHCRKRLGSIGTPRRIELWRRLPHTAAGKIDKRQVADMVQDRAPEHPSAAQA